MTTAIKFNKATIGIDGGLYKLVKLTSIKDARRRNIDINSDTFNKEYPLHIVQKSRTWKGEQWQSVRQFQGKENIEHHWSEVVETEADEK